MISRSVFSRLRRVLLPILVASLTLGAAPGNRVAASGPIRIAASELHNSVQRERTFALAVAASHLALHWTGQPEANVWVALSVDGYTFGPTIPVERDEIGEGRANGETYGNLLLAGGARFARVTSDQPLAHLSVLALDARGSGQAATGAGAVVAAAVVQPSVISRAGWGANESLRFDATGHELWPPVFQPIQKLIVHHTAGQNNDPDPAATVRAIYYYDAVTQGWGDMGYNFLIDEAGRIYEGRYSRAYAAGEYPTGEDAAGNGVTGAHAVGFNSGTVGIALLGTLTNQDATPAARDALTRLLAWIADGHGIDPHGSTLYTNPVNGTQKTFANIAGHRDVAATECPGGVFYATLPGLRDAVATRIAGASTPDFSLSVSPATAAVTAGQRASYAVTIAPSGGFSGTVALSVSGTPTGASAGFSPTSVTGGGSSTLTIDTGTAVPGSYSLVVTGATGSLLHSTTVALTVTAPATVPGAPVLSATTSSRRGVQLTWTVPPPYGSPISGYRVYRGTASGFEAFLTQRSGGSTSYRDTSGASGTVYFYRVSAVNGNGEGAMSNEVSAAAR